MRYVLIGDGESPHLLKWSRALVQVPGLELWAASSRGFLPGFDAVLPVARRLALSTAPDASGGNLGLLRQLPRLARWLREVNAPWLHAHYLTSHGTLAWLAMKFPGVRGQLIASAWGSDILVTPQRSAMLGWATRQVLRACVLSTSDSQVMAERMRAMGAGEVMIFPFGLEAMPAELGPKEPALFFANRGLEPIYEPERVLSVFAALDWPDAQLVVANDGSLRQSLEVLAHTLGIAARVQFVGRLDALSQAAFYERAQWVLSLPQSDSVAVSVLEAMAYGCLPILSDLPANRELVRDGENGLILAADAQLSRQNLQTMAARALPIAIANRAWVRQHALFAPCVAAYVERLRAINPAAFSA